VTYGGSMVQNLKSNPFAIIHLLFFFFFFIKSKKGMEKCDIIHPQMSDLGIFPVILFSRKPILVTCRGADVNLSLRNPILFLVIRLYLVNQK
jgi:hypothetical protein